MNQPLQITEVGQQLPGYEVTAFNFATDSDNKIHDDEVAREYGFRGGLVPGVAMWAYMVRPVFQVLGRDFLEGGYMRARFVHPTYEGDPVRAGVSVRCLEPLALELRLVDSSGELCGVGEAGLLDTAGLEASLEDEASSWPRAPMPAPEDRPLASLESLTPGSVLGSYEVPGLGPDDLVALAEKYRDDHPAFAPGASAAPLLHPVWVLDRANELLVSNVRLGPWIHTGSEVRHLRLPDWSQPLSLRGRVKEAYERKGHEVVVLDLALLGPNDCLYAEVEHTAIVRPCR